MKAGSVFVLVIQTHKCYHPQQGSCHKHGCHFPWVWAVCKPSLQRGGGGGGRVLRMRLFPYRQAPLLNNCLPFEDTHPSVRENRTNMLATGKLRTYGRTGRRTDQNSVLQLPCQLQSSCLDSNPPTGNDSTPVLLLSLTILLMILTSPLPCVE